MSKPEIESVIKTYMEKFNKSVEPIKIQYETAVPKGENYSSEIIRAKIKFRLGPPNVIVRKSFIIKEDKRSSRKEGEISGIFKIEIKMYMEIFPFMEDLMSEYGEKREKIWCDFVGCIPNHTIVLEDLTARNYVVANRKNGLDLEHAIFVIKNLGRFHGMTKILLQRDIIEQGEFYPHYATSDLPIIKNLYEGGLRQLADTMRKSWPDGWKPIVNKVYQEADKVLFKLNALIKEKIGDEFLVLNHGDMWVCNLMFNYNPGDEKPKSVRFVDYQVAHINSLAWDIVHLLYSSMMPKIRNEHLNKLLETYYKSFSSCLKFFKYKNKIPDYEAVKSEIDRLSYYAFVQVTVFYPLTTAETNEAFDIDKMREDTESLEAPFDPSVLTSERVIENIGSELKRFIDLGVI